MKYKNGVDVEVGDEVQVDNRYRGTVVVDLVAGHFKPESPLERWAYLQRGLLINTNYGALLHYPPGHKDELTLLRRRKAGSADTPRPVKRDKPPEAPLSRL